ncbi:hypothetical protein SAMN04488102_103218 [Alkalibacterium subtropicum]|uniref:Uncharacterized protein n=2 Tax=Alkalibacterium TaxID=99906 RepID=A0A1H7SJ42_9LACT|nr:MULTISPECIES: hypothetical protein [Alkalibacterium]GEK88728.1 hypothetical protein APU01nite_07670 [Alkalibacterium putridalgicola]SEL72389.1 hypothetical protein SAMN04488100_10859 [Alkalibacterium putridalgicola]SFC14762.1 hypothetical protein SAMN04488102_103218 [Alkalibacterium subtropicum]
MSHSEENQSVLTPAIQYRYLIECKDKTVELEVENRDVLHNADDEIDCPLDVVLRKNNYTFNDLMSWDAREVRFVEVCEDEVYTLNRVSLNVNL